MHTCFLKRKAISVLDSLNEEQIKIYSPNISPEKNNSPSRISTPEKSFNSTQSLNSSKIREFSPERLTMELYAEQFSKDSIGSDDEENISGQSDSNFILKNLEVLNYKHAGKLIKTMIY